MSLSLLVLVFFITIINYLDRGAMSFAILPIEQDLGLDDAEFGIAASSFAIGYALMTFSAGIIVDRFGSTKIWGLSAILWSLITISIGLTPNFAILISLQIFLGIVEAIHFPALLKTLADWLDPRWIGRAISFSLLGVPVASIIGAPLITTLIENFGWRFMFFMLGGLGITWAIIWLCYFARRTPRHRNLKIASRSEIGDPPWRSLILNRSLIASCAVYFIFGYILYFALFWIPGYFEKVYKISLKGSIWPVMLPWLTASIFILAGGIVSDYLMKRTQSTRISRVLLTGACLTIAGISFFFLSRTTDLKVALFLVSLGLGFTFAINAPIYAFNADVYKKHLGKAHGLSLCCSSIAGIISPALTGKLVQTSGNFNSAIFLVAAMSLTGALIAFLFQKPSEKSFLKR